MSDKKPSTRTSFQQSLRGDRLSVISIVIGLLTLPFLWWLGMVFTIFSIAWIYWSYKDWKNASENNSGFGRFLREAFYDDELCRIVPSQLNNINELEPKELIEQPKENKELDRILRNIMTSANLPKEEQDKALELPSVEDIKLEPNIILVRSYRDYLNYNAFIAEFENRRLKDRRIGTLNSVKAKIFYYDENGKLVGTDDTENWVSRYSLIDSVTFNSGETQRLRLGSITPNRYYFTPNRHTTISLPTKLKIIVHLANDDGWVNNYELEFKYNKDNSYSINSVGETTI